MADGYWLLAAGCWLATGVLATGWLIDWIPHLASAS
jgi:hypothetical protein